MYFKKAVLLMLSESIAVSLVSRNCRVSFISNGHGRSHMISKCFRHALNVSSQLEDN